MSSENAEVRATLQERIGFRVAEREEVLERLHRSERAVSDARTWIRELDDKVGELRSALDGFGGPLE